jgi:hypothetical protein
MRNRDRDRSRDRRDNRGVNNQERGDRRNRFRRRRRRDFSRRPREEKRDAPPCPLCERPINELSNAINHTETGKPAHFDCIMKQIEALEGGLASNEKICYLGKGSFGILRFQKMAGNIPFIIRKRIQYEILEETPEWRKSLDKYSARSKPPSSNPAP